MRKLSRRIWPQFAAAGLWITSTIAQVDAVLLAGGPPALQRSGPVKAGTSSIRGPRAGFARLNPSSNPVLQVSGSTAVAVPQELPPAARDEFVKPVETTDVTLIDLPSALQLAGVQNPQIVIAYQRVLATTAAEQLAAAQWLPNLNVGTNYDAHQGALQQASGNILTVNRNSLYVGAGANAVAAGSVNIPGIQYNLNISQSIYNYLISEQLEEQSRFADRTVRNDVQKLVAQAYGGLLRAEGLRAIAFQTRDYATEVARVTLAYAKTGQGRQSDADRAATELSRREGDVLAREGDVLTASARLNQLLYFESSTRLHPTDNWVVPRVIVPDAIPLTELLAISLYHRPELGERRTAVHAAMLGLDAAKTLPFSPQVIAGFSAGEFGGGSDLVASDRTPRFGAPINQPRFGSFAPRSDVDVVAFWSLQNLGFGNKAQIDSARSRLNASDFERLIVLNQIRAEVAEAYARVQTLQAQFEILRKSVESSQTAFREDFIRTRQNEGRPIEVLDSLRLLARAREAYLNALVDFNAAQFALYTAVGQPPADLLMRPTSEIDEAK